MINDKDDSYDANKVKTIEPNHYSKYSIEPIDFIMENDLDFCTGNVIKYIVRWKDKNGVEDLYKARTYIDFMIDKAENDASLERSINGED